jgi:ribose 1,5-bisphosphokinase PhnN
MIRRAILKAIAVGATVIQSRLLLAARLAAHGRENLDDIRARLARGSFTVPEVIETRSVVNDGTVEEGVARFLQALQPVSA